METPSAPRQPLPITSATRLQPIVTVMETRQGQQSRTPTALAIPIRITLILTDAQRVHQPPQPITLEIRQLPIVINMGKRREHRPHPPIILETVIPNSAATTRIQASGPGSILRTKKYFTHTTFWTLFLRRTHVKTTSFGKTEKESQAFPFHFTRFFVPLQQYNMRR